MHKITIRLEDEVFEEYSALQNILATSGNKLINNLIRAEYNQYESDPKIKETLAMLNEAKEMFAEFQKKLDNAASAK